MWGEKIDRVELASYIVDQSPSLSYPDSYERIIETWDDDTLVTAAFDLRSIEYERDIDSYVLSFVT